MHRMQSGGWPYSKVGRDSSKAPSLCAAVLHAAVFCLKMQVNFTMTSFKLENPVCSKQVMECWQVVTQVRVK